MNEWNGFSHPSIFVHIFMLTSVRKIAVVLYRKQGNEKNNETAANPFYLFRTLI